MKLKKLSIEALSDKTRLSEQQMNGYVGGYSYNNNNYCFYNCMEYLGREVYGSYSHDYNFYGNAYMNGVGSFSGTKDYNDYQLGPVLISNGILNGSIAHFIREFFSSASTNFVTGSGAAALFKYGSNDGVMGFFKTGSGVSHAVILTGYDALTDSYSYYDPSRTAQGSNQRIKAGDLYGAIDCKQ